MSQHKRHPQLLALGAITLWSSLATLGVALAHVPPLLSTAMLIVVSGRAMTWPVALAGVMIVGAAWMGTRARV